MNLINIAKILKMSKKSKKALSDGRAFWNIAVHIDEKKFI